MRKSEPPMTVFPISLTQILIINNKEMLPQNPGH